MPVTDPLRKYVVAKMGRLDRYLDRLSRIDVVLTSENTRQASRRNVAEAHATVRGKVLRAQATDADMYAAIDGLFDKVHQQLTRVKEKARSHKGAETSETEAEESVADRDEEASDIESAETDDGREDRRIVRVKQFAPKPMFPDEAIGELEELGHAFYVFLSAESEKLSVVYTRKDGSFGLIEPAFE